MKKELKILIAISVIAVCLSFPVYADPAGGETDFLGESRGGATSSQTETVEGGNVTGVNISGTQITTKWAGFYGNISGGIILADGSSNTFYEWTVTDLTGAIVYAANTSVSDWSTLANASATDMPSFLTTAATDNYTETLSTGGSGTFDGDALTTYYTTTWNDTAQGSLETHSLLADGGNTLIWAGVAEDGTTGFNGGSLDYQIIVPADGTTTTTYNFYLELP